MGAEVSGQVAIVGTIDDPEDHLWFYSVHAARADRVSLAAIDLDDPDWILIKQSTQEVQADTIAVLDTSQLNSDAHAVVVSAFDVNGRGYVRPLLLSVVGKLRVGNFHVEFTDLSLPLAGIPIEISRVYDTLNAGDEGDFGFGWQLGVQDARIFEMAALGPGGGFNAGNNKFVPDTTKVYLTNPAGRRVGFTYKEEYQSGAAFLVGCTLGCFYRPYFEADVGVYDRLTIDESQVARGGILGALAQGINPEHYTLTTVDGLEYRYHQTAGLQSITDLNGNVATFSERVCNTRVVHPSNLCETAADAFAHHRPRRQCAQLPL